MTDSTDFTRAAEAAAWLRAEGLDGADVAIVLGSGLGAFAEGLEDARAIPYARIPHWPVPTVEGHAGTLVAGRLHGRRVLGFAGRVHAYEGHPMSAVAFGMRVLGRLQVPRVILTNAAGGVNTRFARGALMLIDDHINLMGGNPLVGPNDARLGPRFPDMSEVYSARLRAIATEAAGEAGIALEHGVYVAVLGPSYETPAEIRAFRALGADAVGMSTAPEAIAARHQGLEVLGISCITNMAAGVLPAPLVHDEVMETAREVRGQFIALLEGIVARL
ncbi:MAG: purine-nucleoside phosphorylase [Vicinamibacterales bacterium]|nr:purine-nucleoside phosphorylase [Vicinamibacterales bacterium]